MQPVSINKRLTVNYTGEHRTGYCEFCGTLLSPDPKTLEGVKAKANYCSKCGDYRKGRLIARVMNVRAPDPPACLSVKCLFDYFRECLLCALIASYHSRRIQYAEKNRNGKILDRYRTGDPSPKTIWQAVHANIKLRCPVCRKYNVDPLLGGK